MSSRQEYDRESDRRRLHELERILRVLRMLGTSLGTGERADEDDSSMVANSVEPPLSPEEALHFLDDQGASLLDELGELLVGQKRAIFD